MICSLVVQGYVIKTRESKVQSHNTAVQDTNIMFSIGPLYFIVINILFIKHCHFCLLYGVGGGGGIRVLQFDYLTKFIGIK